MIGMLLSDELKNDILKNVFDYLNPDEVAVFLFGSFAQGKAGRHSDIDIGILADKGIALEKIAAIREALNENLTTLRRIDVVDFNRVVNRVFLKNALGEAELWYQGKDCRTTLADLKKRIIN